jgi:PAS domain S-box-containing protein
MNGMSTFESLFPDESYREDEFRILVSSVKEYAIFMIDPDGLVITWNEGAKNIKGYGAEEIIGRHISVFYTKEDVQAGVIRYNLDMAKTHGSFEDEGWRVKKNGTVFWANVVYTAIFNGQGKLTGYAKVTRDISGRKRLEDEMIQLYREKTRELTQVVERVTDAFAAFDRHWNYTYINKKAAEMIGRLPEEIIGKNIWEEFPEKKEYGFYKNFFKAIEEQKTIRMEEYHPSWQIWISAMLYPSPEGLSVYFQDITDRKRTEEALLKSRESYRQIVETAQEGIWVIDEKNRTIFVNKKMCGILEYPQAEMLGRENFYFMDDEGKCEAAKTIGRRRKGVTENVELRYITKTGKHIWANVSANPIYDDRGTYKGALAMVSDITEKKMLQRQLMAEQMNRQKEITRAVISAQEKERAEIGEELHDNVNQLLAASTLYLNYTLTQPDNQEQFILKSQGYILSAMEEIRKLSHALVGPLHDKATGLVDKIRELITDITTVKDITIHFNHAGYEEEQHDVGLRLVIYRIIQEQLSNILKYAEASEAVIGIQMEEGRLAVTISDNGRGFNTAEKGKGIGLKNIRNRAAVYNGDVQIISSSGNGCTVKIVFESVAGSCKL